MKVHVSIMKVSTCILKYFFAYFVRDNYFFDYSVHTASVVSFRTLMADVDCCSATTPPFIASIPGTQLVVNHVTGHLLKNHN